MSVPLSSIVELLEVRCTAYSDEEAAREASKTRWRVEGVGIVRGRGETSSLLAAEGIISLIKSSPARRRSLRSSSLPMTPEEVSVVSEARTRTGVGAALAVLGLNKS